MITYLESLARDLDQQKIDLWIRNQKGLQRWFKRFHVVISIKVNRMTIWILYWKNSNRNIKRIKVINFHLSIRRKTLIKNRLRKCRRTKRWNGPMLIVMKLRNSKYLKILCHEISPETLQDSKRKMMRWL
jgi:hypothetical protein